MHAHVAAAATALLERERDTGVLLVDLCQGAPCTSSAWHDVRIVLEHSYRRRAQQAATRLLQASETGSVTDLSAVIACEHAALTSCQSRISAIRPA